ncbi:MAG TPA: response regulator [Candidatus Omnitrophota bacterium]|nr:response regulator [Candidatus Omnitrophota bacterium]
MAKVLIVDDEEDLLEFIGGYLKEVGYEVLKTQFGKEAISILLNEKPDVAIIDVRLKDEINGLTVIREIHQKNPGQKMILFTAYQDVQKEALKNGALFCISKPSSLKELEESVEKAMNWKK